MDKQNERELLEEIYRDSYDRRAADIMAAETHSDALTYKEVRNDAFILGIRHAIHLVLPDNEASRLLYLIACVEDYGNDDADEGAPRNVKDAIVRAYASDVDGYDYCVETLKDAFANIMDVDDVIDDTGFLKNVDEDVINDDRPAEDFPIDEMEKWSKETKIMKLLKDCILEYTEIERNELVTAILEDDAASGTDETTN